MLDMSVWGDDRVYSPASESNSVWDMGGSDERIVFSASFLENEGCNTIHEPIIAHHALSLLHYQYQSRHCQHTLFGSNRDIFTFS